VNEDPAALSERIGLILALIMAAAAVCTAWAGFQSTKWSGIQANAYAEASAARTEATRLAIRAGQQRIVDVMAFSQWLNALNEEMTADPSAPPGADYQPREGTISGFIFRRFRLEFRPAMDAWLRTDPFVNPVSPPTPFVLPEYRLAADVESQRLEHHADELGTQAREANRWADNYVLTAVLFALVLFFAGIADRTRGRRTQVLLFVLGALGLLATVGVLVTFPIQF
jgi:hypothetical protein